MYAWKTRNRGFSQLASAELIVGKGFEKKVTKIDQKFGKGWGVSTKVNLRQYIDNHIFLLQNKS